MADTFANPSHIAEEEDKEEDTKIQTSINEYLKTKIQEWAQRILKY